MSRIIYNIYQKFYAKEPTLAENTNNMLELIKNNVKLLSEEKKKQ